MCTWGQNSADRRLHTAGQDNQDFDICLDLLGPAGVDFGPCLSKECDKGQCWMRDGTGHMHLLHLQFLLSRAINRICSVKVTACSGLDTDVKSHLGDPSVRVKSLDYHPEIGSQDNAASGDYKIPITQQKAKVLGTGSRRSHPKKQPFEGSRISFKFEESPSCQALSCCSWTRREGIRVGTMEVLALVMIAFVDLCVQRTELGAEIQEHLVNLR